MLGWAGQKEEKGSSLNIAEVEVLETQLPGAERAWSFQASFLFLIFLVCVGSVACTTSPKLACYQKQISFGYLHGVLPARTSSKNPRVRDGTSGGLKVCEQRYIFALETHLSLVLGKDFM